MREVLRAAVGEPGLDAALERFEERAAIREYDGGYDRAEAERLALADVLEASRRAGQAEFSGG